MHDTDTRSLEKVYRSAVTGLYARLKSNYDFIYRRYGEEGFKLIADMSREYGSSIAARAEKILGNNDIDAIAGYILRIFYTVTRGTTNSINLRKENEHKVVISVTECPLHFTDCRMCQAHTQMEKAVVENINPLLTYRIGRSIPSGDSCCEHIIEEKWSVSDG